MSMTATDAIADIRRRIHLLETRRLLRYDEDGRVIMTGGLRVGPPEGGPSTIVSPYAPVPATGFVATPGATLNDSWVNLEWTQSVSENLGGQELVLRNQDTGLVEQTTPAPGTSIRLTGLKPNANYRAFLYSYSNVNQYGEPATVDFTSVGDTTEPSVPSGVVISPTFRGFTARWDDNPEPDVAMGEGLYRLRYATTLAMTDATVVHVTGTIASVGGLSPDTDYFLTIQAIDSSGNEGAESDPYPFKTAVDPQTEIVDGSITTAKLADAAVVAAKLADLAVETGKLAGGAVTTVKLADSAVSNAKLTTDAVTAAKIAANAVTTVKLADTAVTSGKLGDSAVIAAKLAESAVTTVKLASGAVTTVKLADGAATEAKIGAGAITATKVSDNAITTPKLAANAVTADAIAAGAITSNKLSVIVGGGNRLRNSHFEDWTGGSPAGYGSYNNSSAAQPATVTKGVGRFGTNSFRIAWSVANTSTKGIHVQPATFAPEAGFVWPGGVQYVVSWWARADLTSPASMGVYFNTPNPSMTWLSNPVLTTTWQRYAVLYTRPSDTNDGLFVSVLSGQGGTGWLEFDGFQVERGDVPTAWNPRTDELLPGTILATHLAASAVTADKIATNAITAAKVQAGAIGADAIAANAVVAAKIAAGAINATHIQSKAISAQHLQVGNFANLIPDPDLRHGGAGHGTIQNGFARVETANALTGGRLVRYTHPAGDDTALRGYYFMPNSVQNDRGIPVEPGQRFRFEVVARNVPGTGQYGRFMMYFAAWMNTEATTWPAVTHELTDNWATYSFEYTVPSNVVALAPLVLRAPFTSGGTYDVGAQFEVDRASLFQMRAGTLLVDGAVSADKIAAGAIVVGSDKTVFADGYDPSTKATPDDLASVLRAGAHYAVAQPRMLATFQGHAGGLGNVIEIDTPVHLGYATVRMQDAGTFTMKIRKGGADGPVYLERTYQLAAGENRIALNAFLDEPGTWWIGRPWETVPAHRDIADNYPYDSGSFRIIGRQGDGGTQNFDTDLFYWFYDLEVSGQGINGGPIMWRLPGTTMIHGGMIGTETIMANSIQAAQITTSKIDVNAVIASKIAANAVTADKIAANAVTAAKILAGSITSDHIVTAGLDAAVIKFGTMSGDRIAANSINVNRLTSSTLESRTITIGNGGILQVSGPNQARLSITAAGMRLFNQAGFVTVDLNSSTGAASFAGIVTATGGFIDGNMIIRNGDLRSDNFVSGSSGYRLESNGLLEVHDIDARGRVRSIGSQGQTIQLGTRSAGHGAIYFSSGTDQFGNIVIGQVYQRLNPGMPLFQGALFQNDAGDSLLNISLTTDRVQFSTGDVQFLATQGEFRRFRGSGDVIINTSRSVGDLVSSPGNITYPGMGYTTNSDYLVISRVSGPVLYLNRGATTGAIMVFRYHGDNYGIITVSGGGTQYGTTSDVRAKKDIADLHNATARLRAMHPIRHRWNERAPMSKPETMRITEPEYALGKPMVAMDAPDENGTVEVEGEQRDDGGAEKVGDDRLEMEVPGFLAHELQQIAPWAVIGEPDTVDEDGNPVMQMYDPSKLVPDLVAGWQEIDRRLAAIEARMPPTPPTPPTTPTR